MCARALTILALVLAFMAGDFVGKTRSKTLTDMQAAFVDHYLVTLNAKRSAIKAGYKAESAHVQANQLLNNPLVSKEIKRRMDARAKRLELTADRVLDEIAKVALSDIRQVMEFGEERTAFFESDEIHPDASATIQSISAETRFVGGGRDSEPEKIVTLKVKLHDKAKALDLAARHLGLVGPVATPPEGTAPTAKRDLVTFEEFCERAGYPKPFPKQIEMKDFVIHGTEPRMLLGTRGIGKTEYTTVNGIAYAIYRDPNDTTILSTKVQTNGRSMLKAISRALKANGVELDIDNSDEIRVKGCTRREHNVIFVTIGSGGFRTNHPKRVVFDDPVVPGKVSEADRAQAKTSYEEAIKLTDNIVIIGQPVDFRDLYAHLRGIVTTMEVPYGSIPELDHDLDVQRKAGVDEKSIQASYFLKVTPEGDASFHDINLIDTFPASSGAYAFIDPADGGDTTCIGAFAEHMTGMAIVGRAFKKAWHNCLPEFVEFCVKYGVKKVGFEVNKFGTGPLKDLREVLGPHGISVEGKYTHSNKEARIGLAARYSKNMFLSKQSDPEYRRQVVEYSHDAKNDDAPDTIASFLEWAGRIRPPKAAKKPSGDL